MPFTRGASGAVKLSSNRQGSGIRGSEMEPPKPPETRALAKVGKSQVRAGKLAWDPVKDQNQRSHRPSGQHRTALGRFQLAQGDRHREAGLPSHIPEAHGF